jgi:cobalt-zinc-cadmium efflux system protein
MPTHPQHDHHAHEHGHAHHHDHGRDPSRAHGAEGVRPHGHGDAAHAADAAGLGLVFWLVGGFTIVEAIGGWWSGSLAVLADAGHMFVDTLAIALAYAAHHLAQRPASQSRSFGHSRLQVLAAFVNSLLLLGIVVAILVEAGQRLMTPHPINAPLALGVALIGVLVNLGAARLLHHGHEHDLNVRAAYLHVLSDLAGSGAAALAAAIVWTTGWLAADPGLSLLVTVLIAVGAWRLLRHSAHVLQEGTPEGFDAAKLGRHLVAAVPAVVDVHHVHAWSLTPRETLLTMHARLAPGADAGAALVSIKRVLVAEFAIEHSTIQIEPADCVDSGERCAEPAAPQVPPSESLARR